MPPLGFRFSSTSSCNNESFDKLIHYGKVLVAGHKEHIPEEMKMLKYVKNLAFFFPTETETVYQLNITSLKMLN